MVEVQSFFGNPGSEPEEDRDDSKYGSDQVRSRDAGYRFAPRSFGRWLVAFSRLVTLASCGIPIARWRIVGTVWRRAISVRWRLELLEFALCTLVLFTVLKLHLLSALERSRLHTLRQFALRALHHRSKLFGILLEEPVTFLGSCAGKTWRYFELAHLYRTLLPEIAAIAFWRPKSLALVRMLGAIASAFLGAGTPAGTAEFAEFTGRTAEPFRASPHTAFHELAHAR